MVGLGLRWGRSLRFGCLTQKRLECKELIRLGVSLPQTKGQASRQRLREGEQRVRDEGGWWFSYHLELLFWGRREVGGGLLDGIEVDRGLHPLLPCFPADPRTPPPFGLHVHVLPGPDRRPSARSYYTGALPCSV